MTEMSPRDRIHALIEQHRAATTSEERDRLYRESCAIADAAYAEQAAGGRRDYVVELADAEGNPALHISVETDEKDARLTCAAHALLWAVYQQLPNGDRCTGVQPHGRSSWMVRRDGARPLYLRVRSIPRSC